jgi:hypothetical protein
VASASFQRRRFRLIQAKKRSTTLRRGWTAKPVAVGDTGSLIAGIGEDLLDERERAARGGEQRPGSIAILHAGMMGEQDEAAPVGVDEGVPLAAHDLLAGAS